MHSEEFARCSLSLRDAAFALTAGEGLMTHVRTLAYFTSFLGSLFFIVFRFPFARAFHRPLSLLCLPYAAVALLLTWRLILCFMATFQAWPSRLSISRHRVLDTHHRAPGDIQGASGSTQPFCGGVRSRVQLGRRMVVVE